MARHRSLPVSAIAEDKTKCPDKSVCFSLGCCFPPPAAPRAPSRLSLGCCFPPPPPPAPPPASHDAWHFSICFTRRLHTRRDLCRNTNFPVGSYKAAKVVTQSVKLAERPPQLFRNRKSPHSQSENCQSLSTLNGNAARPTTRARIRGSAPKPA